MCSAPSDLWESTGQEVASGLRALGLPVGPVVTMERSGRGGAKEALKRIQGADKVKGQRSNRRFCTLGCHGPAPLQLRNMATFGFVLQWSSCA